MSASSTVLRLCCAGLYASCASNGIMCNSTFSCLYPTCCRIAVTCWNGWARTTSSYWAHLSQFSHFPALLEDEDTSSPRNAVFFLGKRNIPKISVTTMTTYHCQDILTNYLTPRSRDLLEKGTGPQLVKKFPEFYGHRRFITFTRSSLES